MLGWIRGTMALLCLGWTGAAMAASVGEQGCAALAARVDAIPGRGPAFLPSYDGVEAEPALAGAAFTYDNALAVIALVSCDKRAQALRLGEALLAAATQDRDGPQGRLRNAYRGGALDGPPPPHGWWNATTRSWAEDPMQVGSATGNVAWAGLALMTLADADQRGQRRFIDGAARLADWMVQHTASKTGGFTGGIHGDGSAAQILGWKSTEHNVDAAALFAWLARTRPPYSAPAQAAQAFVAAQWQADSGHFLTGTLPDGQTPNRATSGLDAQLWPLLLENAPEPWRRALAYAERAHGAAGGFDFNDDRDGVWWEGTAQAALAYGAAGRPRDADRLLTALSGQFSPSGYMWATSAPRLTTGLALGPDSTTADFYYYRRPHLAVTAWAVLAAKRWNPFTGRPLR